ncbi:MAG: diguanylate cyclase [Actinomycetota bacterium]|nr:diguanylate cyclase [Actinomycetota bacterium]
MRGSVRGTAASSGADDRTSAALLRHVRDGLLLVDPTGGVRFASTAACRILGAERIPYLPDELIGYVARAAPRPDPVSLTRADGSEVWLEVTSVDATADPLLRGCVLMLRDVTDDVRRREALEASVTQYRMIVETAPNGVWVVDADLVTTLANPKLADILGCPEGIAGRQLRDFVFDEDLPALETLVERRRAGVSEQFEFRLRRSDGHAVWTLISTNPIFDDAGGFVGAFALVSDIGAIKQNEQALARQALLDPLTGLPNRTMFLDQLTQALARRERHGGEVAVLFCDLDRFKEVNDTHGHAAGDALLTEVATRLRAAVRVSDVVARLSGDEFVVLCEQVGGLSEAGLVAADIAAALTRPVVVAGAAIRVTVSIGVAATPQAPPEEILAEADEAMYRAKAGGRARVEMSVGHVARAGRSDD